VTGGLRAGLLAIDRLTTGVALAAACAALVVAVGAGAWQILTRFLLDQPSPWSEALVRISLIWMALLGLAGAVRRGALVSIDVAHRLARGRWRMLLELVALVATALFMGVLFWFGIAMAERVQFQRMAGLEISIAWGYAAIPVGAAFTLIGALAHFVDRRSGAPDAAV
jgi:TRAP-type C4-dicarboxylate transport system permease small subunit